MCQFPAIHTYGTLTEVEEEYPLDVVFYIAVIFQHIGDGGIQISILPFGSSHAFIILNRVIAAEFPHKREIFPFRIFKY